VSSRGSRLLVLGLALGVLAAGLVGTLVARGDTTPPAIAEGDIYATDAGDPLDVSYGPDDKGRGCIHVGASYYDSSTGCIDPATVDDTGAWMLVMPTVKRKPPVVVGVLPADGAHADVRVGSARIAAETRGRWFLAELPPGSLGPGNNATVTVRYTG
jgi:hypothetical protein